MLTTFKASVKKLQGGLQVEANSRGFKILMDEPKNLGGTDQGLNPVEGILCALGSCQTICAAAFAKKCGVDLEDFHVEVEGDLDTDGFLDLADVRNGFQEIRFTMHIKTKSGQEAAEKLADYIESHCPVGDCLENGVKLVRAGVVVD